MTRVVLSVVVLGTLAGAAVAQPTTSPSQTEPSKPAAPPPPSTPATPTPPAARPPVPPAPVSTTLPAVGSNLAIAGMPGWPKLDWLYDVPSVSDSAGKVVVHWFCAPKLAACGDDLARLVTLKETGRVYIVAYINGTKPQAQKLDPIRESEGVGRGTLAYGRNMPKLFKDLKITGATSIVVDVDGKVQLVTATGQPGDLDARDSKVAEIMRSVKEYTSTADAPKTVKPNEKFQLTLSVKLASWLKYSDKTPMELRITAPADIKCDQNPVKGDQIKVADKVLTATATCSGRVGTYEIGGDLRFGYDAPGGGTGIGNEATRWKFEIK